MIPETGASHRLIDFCNTLILGIAVKETPADGGCGRSTFGTGLSAHYPFRLLIPQRRMQRGSVENHRSNQVRISFSRSISAVLKMQPAESVLSRAEQIPSPDDQTYCLIRRISVFLARESRPVTVSPPILPTFLPLVPGNWSTADA